MNTSPPNIVFIMADQLAAGALSCYGFEAETSPNLDRLAAHSVHPVGVCVGVADCEFERSLRLISCAYGTTVELRLRESN